MAVSLRIKKFVILMNLDITLGNKEVFLAIDGKKQGIFRESKIYNLFSVKGFTG
jgi:hypothetical protein